MNKQELRSLAQRRLNEIRNEAARHLAANPGEIGEEAPGLEETFERAEPAPGLRFRLRKATQDETASHLNADATRKAAVVVNSKSEKLAEVMQRQRNAGKQKPDRQGRTESDKLAEVMRKVRGR